MRTPWLAAMAALCPLSAAAQDQQAATPPPPGGPVYDMVAADRETAWRINRHTGEVMVCRADTTSTLDGVRAQCAIAVQQNTPQQARTPPDGGINRP